MSNKPVRAALKDDFASGNYKDIFTETLVEIEKGRKIKMDPWGYMVLVK